MITISIRTTESDRPAKFDVAPDQADECVKRLAHPDEILVLTPRSGDGTAYIPVRNITYLHVSDDHNAADPNYC